MDEEGGRKFSMDVYDFINSEAIAGHCREQGYSFTPLQTAWLINRSGRHTFEEKHRAYGWVIEHLPDEEVDLGFEEAAGSRTVSLRWFLKEYMRLERACPENCFHPDSFYYGGLSRKEEDILEGFDHVCFVCPTPFRKGDIVWAPYYEDKNPFIFLNIWYEDMDEEEQKRYAGNRYNGAADMTADGYFQNENGQIYWECMHDYMSLEYYRGELNGKKRILKALSSFLKDEIDVGLLMNAYHILMSEEHIRQARGHMNITREGLCLAGLAEREEKE